MGRLEGKVAIITGGAKGQGAAEVELFASEGATVVFGDILDEEGKQVEARVAELGGVAEYMHHDVTSDDDWQNIVELAESKYGKVDILVNNAGISMRHEAMDVSNEDWDVIMDVNAKGVFLGTRYVIPAMQRAGGRLDHQHLVHSGHTRTTACVACVRSLQGCGTRVHQEHGRAFRVGRNQGQLDPPWPDRHRHDPRRDQHGPPRDARRRDPDGPPRTGGRHRLRRSISGVRRGVVHNSDRAGDRRRGIRDPDMTVNQE